MSELRFAQHIKIGSLVAAWRGSDSFPYTTWEVREGAIVVLSSFAVVIVGGEQVENSGTLR